MEHVERQKEEGEAPGEASLTSVENEGKPTSTQGPSVQGAPSNTDPSQTGASSDAAANPMRIHFPGDDGYYVITRSTERTPSFVLPALQAYL